MFEQDYIMRIIHQTVRTLLKLLFHIDEEQELPVFLEGKSGKQYDRLLRMAEEGNINEAENLLYEIIRPEDRNGFGLALQFYEYLNTLDDEFLQSSDYSREEIQYGIGMAARLYGYGGIVSTLFMQ